MTLERTLKERLARYMDPQAFEPVPNCVKYTSATMGMVFRDERRSRRERALKRADAAIRFFMKPENAELLAYRSALSGSVAPVREMVG